MSHWKNKTAIDELDKLISKIELLKTVRRFSSEHTRWVANTLRFLEQVFGRGSRYYLTFSHFKWAETGSFIVSVWDPEGERDKKHQEAYVHNLDSAEGLLLAALDELKTTDIEEVYQGKDTGPESSEIVKVLNLIERKLRKVMRKEPENEREVQDAIENLFITADLFYSREKDSIEYSSKTYIPDFTLKKIDTAIEVKFCNQSRREKDLIAEINDDILAYKTKFGNIIFVIYDIGIIRDIDRFSANFEEQEGVVVRIIKH